MLAHVCFGDARRVGWLTVKALIGARPRIGDQRPEAYLSAVLLLQARDEVLVGLELAVVTDVRCQ